MVIRDIMFMENNKMSKLEIQVPEPYGFRWKKDDTSKSLKTDDPTPWESYCLG